MKAHIPAIGLLLAAALASCHDDKDSLPELEQHTYTGREALDLEYNGTEIAGKRVTVTPGSDNTATVVFDSQVALSQLGDAFRDIPPFAGPGVLPGSPRLSIRVPLGTDGGEYTFAYSGETDFVTYSVHGEFDDKEMDVDFTGVKLKDLTFAGGAWKPMPADRNPLSAAQPFHIVWETSAPLQIPGLQNGIQDLLRTLVNVPFIPVYNNTATMSLTQVIANGLKSVGMTADGNMPVTYLQSANGAATFADVPYGTFQYVPLNDRSLRLYANPTDLLTLVLLNNTNRNPNIPEHPFGVRTRADGTLAELVASLAGAVLPMVSEGLPMACVRQGDTMALYASTELLLPLLKGYVVPILRNPVTRGVVEDFINNNAELQPYAAALMLAYDALPAILDQTTKLELGLNFVNAR